MDKGDLGIFNGWLWFKGLEGNLETFSLLNKKTRDISFAVVFVLFWILWKEAYDVKKHFSDYINVEEELKLKVKLLMSEQVSRIVRIMSSKDVVVNGSLNLMHEILRKQWIDLSICKENKKIGLESVQEIKANIQKKIILGSEWGTVNRWLDYILEQPDQKRYYLSTDCYNSYWDILFNNLNLSSDWWKISWSYRMNRIDDSTCHNCHVDNVNMKLSIDINDKTEKIKDKILEHFYFGLFKFIGLMLWVCLLFLQNKKTSKINELTKKLLNTIQNVEKIFNTTSQWFCMLEWWKDWNIIYVNPSLLKLLWYEKEEMIWKKVIDFICEKDMKKFDQVDITNLIFEICLAKKDWTFLPIKVHWSAFRDANWKITHSFAFITDLTEARQALQVKQDFLGVMSHELRTPLNALIWYLELLIEEKVWNKEQKWYLNMMNASSKNLLSIINGILDFSKMESWKMNLEQISVNISVLLRYVNDILNKQITDKWLQLVLNIQDLSSNFIWDPTKITQILTNLIWNAIKFTEEWTISVVCSLVQSWDEWWKNLSIEVSDTGIWMTKKQLKTIFEPFMQADTSITREYWWTWLWLSITKKLVEAMWWNIQVKSEHWKWTTFIVSIPFVEVEEKEVGEEEKWGEIERLYLLESEGGMFNAGRQITTSIENATVLIVDDDRVNLLLIKKVLKILWFKEINIYTEVVLWENYDLIFMDERMPGQSWSDMAKKIREQDEEVVIISSSADWDNEHLAKIKKAWMDGYLVKPISLESLGKIIDFLLKK